MKVKVHISPWGSGAAREEMAIEIFCGGGEQLLRWLATAAVDRFVEFLGEPLGTYNPQSLMTRGGRILDADAVLNEILEDGELLPAKGGKEIGDGGSPAPSDEAPIPEPGRR